MNSIDNIQSNNPAQQNSGNPSVVSVVGNSIGNAPTPVNTPPKVEEFKYQPKPRLNMKKVAKIILSLITFVILLIPIAFLFTKYYPQFFKKAEKKGEITWWSLGMSEEVLNKMIADYQVNNPKAQIKLVIQSDIDYRERLANTLKEGKGPDVFTIHNSWVPMMINDLDALPEKVYPKETFAKDYYPIIVRNLSTSDGIVGIPLEYDALTLFINEDIFSFAGKKKDPETWDEFSQIAGDLTITGQKLVISQSGAAMGLTSNVDYWPEIVALLMLQNKSNLLSPSGKNALEAINTFGEYYNTKKTWNETLPNSTTAFADGKLAMLFSPAREAFNIKQTNPNLRFRTVVVPQVRKDDPNESEVAYSTYWVQSVWKNSSDKDLAWDFLKFISSEESLTKMYDLSKSSGVRTMIYPRISMRDKLINDRVFGSVVALAPSATSWYLADKTNDGAKGINTIVNEAYKKLVDQSSKRRGTKDPLPFFKPLITELKINLTPYNITK